MVEVRRRVIRLIDWLAIGAVAMTGLGWIGEARGWFDPHPFANVRDVSVVRNGEVLIVEATYDKTRAPCDLVLPIAVFGYVFGERFPLRYEPIRRVNEGAQRFEGQQLMRLRVHTDWEPIDRVEVFTRHDCEGRRVDTQMVDAMVPTEGVTRLPGAR